MNMTYNSFLSVDTAVLLGDSQ